MRSGPPSKQQRQYSRPQRRPSNLLEVAADTGKQFARSGAAMKCPIFVVAVSLAVFTTIGSTQGVPS
jgi:hypothetical protein